MKRTTRLLVTSATAAAIAAFCSIPVMARADITISTLYFPDDNFRSYVTEFDKDGNGELSYEERDNVSEINCPNYDIGSLEGIEYFHNATKIICSLNYITELDLSSNVKLQELDCHSNDLTNLNIDHCGDLSVLKCKTNKLTSLNVKKNPCLKSLNASGNKLTELDLSNCPVLTEVMTKNSAQTSQSVISYGNALYVDSGVNCIINKDLFNDVVKIDAQTFPDNVFRSCIKSFDIDGNGSFSQYELDLVTEIDLCEKSVKSLKGIEVFGKLQTLKCWGNELTSLDLSGNREIKRVNAHDNKLTSINLTCNPDLYFLRVNNNPLKTIDISRNKRLSYLFCSATEITELDISNCPELVNIIKTDGKYETFGYYPDEHCAYVIGGIQIAFSYDKNVILTGYEEMLSIPIDESNFPDPGFRKYLNKLDQNGDGRLGRFELTRHNLSISDPEIRSLEGIENFKQLRTLACRYCTLESLDLSTLKNLTELVVDDCGIKELILPKEGSSLNYLYCSYNDLTELDLSYSTKLHDIICRGNQLKTLDFINCPDVYRVVADDTEEWVKIKNCNAEDIRVGEKRDLVFDELTSFFPLYLDDLFPDEALRAFMAEKYWSPDGFMTRQVARFIDVIDLTEYEDRDKIKSLEGIENFDLLRELKISGIKLGTLDAGNFHMDLLECSDCGLTSLKLNDNVGTLYCNDNALGSIDLPKEIRKLYCYHNNIETIDVPEGYIIGRVFENEGMEIDGITEYSSRVGHELYCDSSVKFTGAGANAVVVKATPTPRPIVTKKPATPTPLPTRTPTGAPTNSPTKSPTAVPTGNPVVTSAPTPAVTVPVDDKSSSGKLIREFVTRIYQYVLDREPEKEGVEFWTSELYNFRRTGAEVGLQFIFSDEFVNRGLSDADFVTVLYKTFFDREPEEGGFKFWTGALADGTMDRMAVANGFVYSQEWADTCARYGIRSGGIVPTVRIEPTELTFAFVERLYTTAMKRESDASGKDFWARSLANFETTGENVGAFFFMSDEMTGFGLSDEEFVTRLYKTFMDRDPEKGGFNFWVGYLADGGSRENVVLGFTRSEEFVAKCITARILPY